MSTEVLQEARRKYDIATNNWRAQREAGGIVPLDPSVPAESDELAKGVKYRCATPAGAAVMMFWQKCKAELDAAAANVRRDQGDMSCPTCPRKHPDGGPVFDGDNRLPPERDEDGLQ